MTDYKMEAAKAALKLIKPGQVIGFGAGTTVSHLIALISGQQELASRLVVTTSSFKTSLLLQEKGLRMQPPSALKYLDVYFDGCDQFDNELNALKSGGGIHTTEKVLASMANEFILIADEEKFVPTLGNKYPLVIEILPQALQIVLLRIGALFPTAQIKMRMSSQKDGAVISENGNYLADIFFASEIGPEQLNRQVKMMPGIVDHSLFYRMAHKALIAGASGVRVIKPVY